MKIKHTFKGDITGRIKSLIEDNCLSPNSGYTQAYAEREGKSYEGYRAKELFGDDWEDFWEWQQSEYIGIQ